MHHDRRHNAPDPARSNCRSNALSNARPKHAARVACLVGLLGLGHLAGCNATGSDARLEPRPPVFAADNPVPPTTFPSTQEVSGAEGFRRLLIDYPRQLLDNFRGETALENLARSQDELFPDVRREGIMQLVARDYGRTELYVDVYRKMALADPDPMVRATAVRALNISRDASSTPLFVNGLNSDNPMVRLESAKALSNMPNPAAEGPLTRIALDPAADQDLRIAAIDALRHYENLDNQRRLVTLLESSPFGIAYQARESLRRMTGQDLKYNPAAWLALLTNAGGNA